MGGQGEGEVEGADVRHFLFHCSDQPCHCSLCSDSETNNKDREKRKKKRKIMHDLVFIFIFFYHQALNTFASKATRGSGEDKHGTAVVLTLSKVVRPRLQTKRRSHIHFRSNTF